jgi:AsmA protein
MGGRGRSDGARRRHGVIERRPASIDAAQVREMKAQGLGATEIAKPRENPSLWLGFGGTADFGDRGLDVHAIAKSAAGVATAAKEAPDFRFDIGGAWDDLAFGADVRNLIRRSGAAAPLFSQQRDASKPLVPSAEAGQ